MREFLITKFLCAKCGNNLQLTYNMPKVGSFHADGEPTGAKQLEDMKEAARVLMSA